MTAQELTIKERLNRMYRYQELLRAISYVDEDTGDVSPLGWWDWDGGNTAEILTAFAAADEVSGHSMSDCTQEITDFEERDDSILEDAWENLRDCLRKLAHGEDVVARNNLGGLADYAKKRAVSELLDERKPYSKFSPEERLGVYSALHDTNLNSYQDLSDIMERVVSLPCIRKLKPAISLEADFEPSVDERASDIQLLELDADILSGRDFEPGIRRLGAQVSNWRAIQEFSKNNPLPGLDQLAL